MEQGRHTAWGGGHVLIALWHKLDGGGGEETDLKKYYSSVTKKAQTGDGGRSDPRPRADGRTTHNSELLACNTYILDLAVVTVCP